MGGDGGLRTFIVAEEAGKDIVGARVSSICMGMGEAFTLTIEDEVGIVDEGHAVCMSELLCA